mgnify:CR=1 FL=1
MAQVRLEGVSKAYQPGTFAARDVTFALEENEILALLGPSGCGKTTTLRLIAGFEWPDEGTIHIGDRLVAGEGCFVGPEKRGVGMVFQDYPLFPHRTVAQNVAFGLHRLDRRTARRRALELLERVGMAEYADRYPHQLSGGQQQRVALAQALAPRPQVLLMDEPFSNLDASLRYELRLEVRRLLKELGTSAILVTHDQKEAFAVADRIAVMNGGRIEQIDSPYTLYSKPRTRFVAEFLGHAALLDGVVESETPAVLTELGAVPCAYCPAVPGQRVTVSLRPDSLVIDPQGPFQGRVAAVVHEGHIMELSLDIPCRTGSVSLRTFVPPDLPVRPGDALRFAIVPDRVAIISQ